MQKVFGIGFHKTGTTSLEMALKQLGFRVTGPNNVTDPDIGTRYLDIARELSAQYDAFQDNPWPLVFREMDALWPEAKFILTTRDPQRWIRSQLKYFDTEVTPMREHIYGAGRGSPVGNEAHYIAVMEAHNDAVRAHFAGRPGKLLEMTLENGDGWAELCGFLGLARPADAFPHANKAGSKPAAAPPPPLARRLRNRAARFVKRRLNRG